MQKLDFLPKLIYAATFLSLFIFEVDMRLSGLIDKFINSFKNIVLTKDELPVMQQLAYLIEPVSK